MSLELLSEKINEVEKSMLSLKEDFVKSLETIFASSEDLQSVSFSLYTPTFNDGSACTPTFDEDTLMFFMSNPNIYEPYIVRTRDEDIDEGDNESEAITDDTIACQFLETSGWTNKDLNLETRYKSLSHFISANEAVVSEWFGGNCSLRFYRTGRLEVDECYG